MPTSICPQCQRRRAVVDYIAKLPLRCTGCGGALAIDWSDGRTLEYIPANNVNPSDPMPSDPTPSVAALLDDLADPATTDYPLGNYMNSVALSSTDFSISITPDRELVPLVVSEKLSYSAMELPPLKPGQSSGDETDKSKLAGRLKEITSLSGTGSVDAPVVLTPVEPPEASAQSAAPRRGLWDRLTGK